MLTSLVAFACVAGLAEGFIGTLPASSRWAPRSPLVTSAGSGKRLLFGRSSSNSSNTSKNGPVVSTMTVSPDVVGVSSSPAGAPEPNKYDLDSWAKVIERRRAGPVGARQAGEFARPTVFTRLVPDVQQC